MFSPIRSVAVIICAYTEGRWDDTLSAHDSLIAQSVPVDEIVLVVDYNPELLARLAETLPHTRIIPNRYEQGLSGARNTGIAATTSDVIVFLDDDATAHPEWVHHMTTPLGDPSVVGVGGWAVPRWDNPGRPTWFPEAFLWVVGCSYEGQSKSPGDIRNPLGCAMALRRTALASTAGFSDGIGRVGTKPLGCEETELAIRVARANPGTRMVGAPEAIVHHRVTGSRLTVRYFLSRCYWEGVSKAVVTSLVGAEAALASERTYVTKVLPRAFFREIGRGLRGQGSSFGIALAVAAGLCVTSTGYLRGRRIVTRTDASAHQPSAAAPSGKADVSSEQNPLGRPRTAYWDADLDANVETVDSGPTPLPLPARRS